MFGDIAKRHKKNFDRKFFLAVTILHVKLGRNELTGSVISSHRRCSIKKDVLKHFAKFTCVGVAFLIKLQGEVCRRLKKIVIEAKSRSLFSQ